MPDYTSLGISFPIPTDEIKRAQLEAKLAEDIRQTALTANQAILTEGERAESAAKAETADAEARLKDLTRARESRSEEWAWPITDRDGYVLAGINARGEFDIRKPSRSSRTRVACIGDSLTQGFSAGTAWTVADAYPAKLQAVMPSGVTVFNRGYAGMTTDIINMRVGAMPLWVRIPGGSIPATGPVTVTCDQHLGFWGAASAWNLTGSLAGVPGVLSHSNADVFTFTRTTSGDAVTVAAAEFRGADAGHFADTVIYFAGRNDVSFGGPGMDPTTADHVVGKNRELVEALTPHHKQFALAGTITRTVDKQGQTNHQVVMDINTRLKALYPGHFVDVQDYLVNRAMADMGIAPTPADTQAVADYTVPPSLMDDDTHYSRATANAIAVNLFAPFLKQKGWV